MKLPLSWLRELAPVPWNDAELARRMTGLGFEIEACAPVAPPFTGVIVAEITSAEPHPQADKLRVCQVNTGAGDALQVVCGAPNARAGLRTALATVGAELPGGLRIKAARLRGVESAGMLCSARELQLAEANAGIIELPADAPVGESLRDYLALDEVLLEVGITPNRGDAMSALGLARELAAAGNVPLNYREAAAPAAGHAERHPVRLEPGAGCARFLSCVIRGIDNRRASPAWLRERLERCGLRPISPAVDVTNLVLLELGQPMHAYDRAQLRGGIVARLARAGEAVQLLDGREVALEPDVLVIADDAGIIGMAGIMGGERSSISEATADVVLEVAWFDPARIAGRARRHGLQTDSSQRFERGVDPEGQRRAITRAAALLVEIAGGSAGPIDEQVLAAELPVRAPVRLRAARAQRLLGLEIPAGDVQSRLAALGMSLAGAGATGNAGSEAWQVTPPSWRFDVTIEADLIEELARTIGLDALPEAPPRGQLRIAPLPEARIEERVVLVHLVALGYHEAITFGFTDPQLQQQLLGAGAAVTLVNPIAANLAVMRRSLWPGLIGAARENLRRQRDRVRLFEVATCFDPTTGSGLPRETARLGGIVVGSRRPEQWGADRAEADYFDLRGDVQSLLGLGGQGSTLAFEPGDAPSCLHPGRSARIVRDGVAIGVLGELHPELVRALDFAQAPLLFELDYGAVATARPVKFRPLSAFPQVRRDLSFTVPTGVPFGKVAERVNVSAASLLRELRLFDIYQGPGVETGRKSIALGLIFQDLSRTLTDTDIEEAVRAVCSDLGTSVDAKIRD